MKLNEDEHIARAMLLGMHYHAGNGEPFYYKKDHDGIPDVTSFLDADTLEPMIDHSRSTVGGYDWKGLHRRARAKEHLKEEISWLK